MRERPSRKRAGSLPEVKAESAAQGRYSRREPAGERRKRGDPRQAGAFRPIDIPEAFSFLLERTGGPKLGSVAHRIAFGGRGSAKSHSFAMALVLLGRGQKLRIFCLREIQNDIEESVKTLLEDKIKALGLGWFYKSTKTHIIGLNGTRFSFKGMWARPDSLKGIEGADIVWVEEASSVSQLSITKLIPTVRKPGSEIWWTWNPDSEDDPVDVLFRGPADNKAPNTDPLRNAPPRTVGARVNWDQNPFFTDKMREQMEHARKTDPNGYAHVWLGEYNRNSDAQVFHNWREEEFDTPDDVERFYFGGDFGFAKDPAALVRCWINWKTRTLYIDREACKTGVQIDHLPAFFAGDDKQDPPRWTNGVFGDDSQPRYEGVEGAIEWPITCDSSRPDTISYLTRRGFKIIASKKGKDSVKEGIEFLKNFTIVVHSKRCPATINELIRYSWKVDKKTQHVLPKLVDDHNHIIDSLRYAIEALRHAMKGQALFDLERLAAESRERAAAEPKPGAPPVYQPGSVEYAAALAQEQAQEGEPKVDVSALMAMNS